MLALFNISLTVNKPMERPMYWAQHCMTSLAGLWHSVQSPIISTLDVNLPNGKKKKKSKKGSVLDQLGSVVFN